MSLRERAQFTRGICGICSRNVYVNDTVLICVEAFLEFYEIQLFR